MGTGGRGSRVTIPVRPGPVTRCPKYIIPIAFACFVVRDILVSSVGLFLRENPLDTPTEPAESVLGTKRRLRGLSRGRCGSDVHLLPLKATLFDLRLPCKLRAKPGEDVVEDEFVLKPLSHDRRDRGLRIAPKPREEAPAGSSDPSRLGLFWVHTQQFTGNCGKLQSVITPNNKKKGGATSKSTRSTFQRSCTSGPRPTC